MIVKHKDLERIAQQSLVNCHAIGLDSVMFDNTPGVRVRAFVTQENHTLYLNDGKKYRLGLALHPHHCDLTMTHIGGSVAHRVGAMMPSCTTVRFWKVKADLSA